MKKPLFIILGLVVLVLIGGVALTLRPKETQKTPNSYASKDFGIEFSYPEKYFVAYVDSSSGERSQYAIVLAEDTPENRELFSNPNLATDGPPTITIGIFQNNLDGYTARSFVEETDFSNFKLSDGNLIETMVFGEPALRYRATGLYENENVVVARPNFVFMFTAFFNSPTDQILSDFEEVLGTVKFGAGLSEANARVIAETTCIKGGDALASGGTFNENTKTWWFDANLNATREGCNPACVVSEETKTAEINWRCTGVVPPEPVAIECLPEQRNADVCIQVYQPVCATVEIQCIRAPCNPIQETFSNSCTACQNSLVKSYVDGECDRVGGNN